MQKEVLTLEEVLSITGPAQYITITEDGQAAGRPGSVEDPIARGRRVRITAGETYADIRDRIVRHISTAYDDALHAQNRPPKRGMLIVLEPVR